MQQIYFRSSVRKGEGDDSPQMPEVQWLHCVMIRLALKI